MSVFIKRANNQMQKIAGHTILLDANVSEMRSGEVSVPALAVDSYSVIDIIFEEQKENNSSKKCSSLNNYKLF